MNDYQMLYKVLQEAGAGAWVDELPNQLKSAFDLSQHGTLAKWQNMIADLPMLNPSIRRLDRDAVQIGDAADLVGLTEEQLKSYLMQLHPWRKGPYELFGIKIDTEWRSDWKWNRLKEHIAPLKYRLVLDVGCGNGYHCWRMLGGGAKMVVGIDPLMLNVMQFQLIKKMHGDAPVYVLPFGLEQLPSGLKVFDTVFSMGVLYHRRSPIDHLLELKDCLRPGGELILETLIIDGGAGEALVPESRYARMRNVWFLPSCETLIGWMKRCGFNNIRLIDVTTTTSDEQRTTEWMRFHSLEHFLDPENPRLTCEGLPAPKRAIFIAESGK
ncbi:MAG: tRNA 5-methoxyuridine(34)/uridine 5-oxyacetic acid(34) synthase CmoB [Gammaproteobacteria bacterium]